MGAVLNLAGDRISARIMKGGVVRSDGFFSPTADDRPPSVVPLEGALLKARDEFEEKKLRYIAALVANIVFVDSVSPNMAFLLLKRLDRVSYRQMVILSLVGRAGSYDVRALREPNHADAELEALKREEMDLHSHDLGSMGLLTEPSGWTDALGSLAQALYDLAALNEIPVEESTTLDALITSLWNSAPCVRPEVMTSN